jgi:3-oxoacyl-[acyl-carrier-protein] synthase II
MDVVVTGLGVAVTGLDGADGLLGDIGPGAGVDPVRRLNGRGLRYKDRATKLAMCAGRDALLDSGLVGDGPEAVLAVPGETVGVLVSSNYGNVDTICDAVRTIAEHTYLGTSPMALPATSSNVIASWLAITYGLGGANLTLCNGPTSGLDAMFWAGLLIRSGRIRSALVVGVEPANDAVRHVSGGGDPRLSPDLFDGAVALVIEDAGAARARGRRPLAALGPYARRADAGLAVSAVRRAEPANVGLWCPPADGGPVPDGAPACLVVRDLTAVLGECSGALGVLQCAAGTAWLSRPESAGRAVLAVSGSGSFAGDAGDDAAAAMMLVPVTGTRAAV